MSEPYLSPVLDEEVRAALAVGLEPHGQVVVSFEVHSGDPSHTLLGPEVVVVLSVLPGLAPEELSSLLGEVTASWSENAVLQARVDGLGIRVVPS